MGVKVGFEAALGNRKHGSHLSGAVFKFFQIVTHQQTDQSCECEELTTPSVKNNSFTLSVVGQYTLKNVFGGLGSAWTHWEAIALPRSLAIRY